MTTIIGIKMILFIIIMIESCSDDSGIFDDDIGHPVSVFSLKAHFKDDIRMRM